MQVKQIPFDVRHLDIIEMPDELRRSVLGLDTVRYALSHIPGGPLGEAITLMLDGRVLLCMGYFAILPGVVEVWLFPSIYFSDHALSVVKEVRAYLEVTAGVFSWHRAQTVTQVNAQHRKWMRTLGFVEEGVMKQYFNRQDYILSARYFDEVAS